MSPDGRVLLKELTVAALLGQRSLVESSVMEKKLITLMNLVVKTSDCNIVSDH